MLSTLPGELEFSIELGSQFLSLQGYMAAWNIKVIFLLQLLASKLHQMTLNVLNGLYRSSIFSWLVECHYNNGCCPSPCGAHCWPQQQVRWIILTKEWVTSCQEYNDAPWEAVQVAPKAKQLLSLPNISEMRGKLWRQLNSVFHLVFFHQ